MNASDRVAAHSLANASHRVHPDRTGRRHYGLRVDAEDRGHWLTRCRLWLLRGESLERSQPEFLLLAMIVFDAIVTKTDLEAAWTGVPKVYRDGEAACLEWCSADGRLDRRILSAVTVLSWSAQARRELQIEKVVVSLMETMRRGIDPSLHRDPSQIPSSFHELLDWVRHALLMQLSGDMFAHVSATDPLTAVPRSCLARRRRRLALRLDDTLEALDDDEDGAMTLMDALYQAGSDENAASVELLCKACRSDPDEPSVGAQRRRMLADLQALAPRCANAGHWSSVLLLWAIDLVRVGTRRKRPLSPRTIEPYVQLVALRLWRALRTEPFEEHAQIDWQQIYQCILDDPGIEPSQRGKAAAALTAFHEFAEQALDAPRLGRALDAEMPVLAPRANVVWPHELHWVLDRLAETSPNDRLIRQIEAVVALLTGACLRIADVWHVHMFGVEVFDDVVIIAIDPLPGAGTGKSPSARRPVEVRDDRCRWLLARWHERRIAEGALPRDLLFGDPADPRRPGRAGAVAFLLNRALKAVTGDPDVGTHTLRHASATFARESLAGTDPRAMDRASALAGHASTRTTLVHYVHLFEPVLRQQIDRSLGSLRLTEAQACSLSGTRPGWLRKRWQRTAAERNGVTWGVLDAMAARVDMPDVADGFAFEPPRMALANDSSDWSFELILRCLCDLADGRTPAQVRLRRGLTSARWQSVETVVRSWHRTAVPGLPWQHCFRRVGQPKWQALLRELRRSAHPDALRPVCDAWRCVLHGDYLSMADMAAALPLLRWLAACGIRPAQLVVSYQADRGEDALDAAIRSVEVIFGGRPCIRPERLRRGRPPLYLMLRSDDEREPSNAALSVAGLHALLFCTWVWIQLSEGA